MSNVNPENRVSELDIVGALGDNQNLVDADLVITDEAGQAFMMQVMTRARFEDVRDSQPDLGHDEDAPHVFILNQDSFSLESLARFLGNGPRILDLEPYVQSIEPDEE